MEKKLRKFEGTRDEDGDEFGRKTNFTFFPLFEYFTFRKSINLLNLFHFVAIHEKKERKKKNIWKERNE